MQGRAALIAIMAFAAGLGTAAYAAPRTLAHMWYPARCCGGHDCMMVDSIEMLEDGDMLFRAGSISVVVPAEFQRLPSQDSHTHICVYRINSGEYRPRCVFVPGTT